MVLFGCDKKSRSRFPGLKPRAARMSGAAPGGFNFKPSPPLVTHSDEVRKEPGYDGKVRFFRVQRIQTQVGQRADALSLDRTGRPNHGAVTLTGAGHS